MNPISSVIIPIITGSGTPDNAVGVNGQYYYDGTNGMMYGPKAGGAWPAGVRLQDNVTQGTATGQLLVYNAVSGKFEPLPASEIVWDTVNKKIILPRKSTNSAIDIGSFAIQSTATNNGFLIDNAYFNGTSLVRMNTGYVSMFQFLNGDLRIRSGPTASAGSIVTSIIDIVAFKNSGLVGFGNLSPRRKIDILDSSTPQLRLTHTDNSIYAEYKVDANGDLTLYQTGDEIIYSGMSSTQERTIYSVKRTMPVATDASRTGQVLFSVSDYAANRPVFQADADGTKATVEIPCILRVGEVQSGNYTEIEADGTIHFFGDATVFEDLNFDPDSGGGPAATLPDYVTINNVIHREFTSANNQFCGSVKELPHNYKLSSSLSLHLHLFLKSGESAGTTGVTFTIYWELRQSTGVTSGSVNLSVSSTILTNSQYKWTVTGTSFSGAAELGAQLALTLSRTGGDAGDVVVTTYGVHYEIDTIGSRQITTK